MTLSLPPHLQRILDAEYPRFSPAEMERRRAAIGRMLAAHAVDHLVYCGFNRNGSAVQWLSQWPVTAEAVGVLTPGEPEGRPHAEDRDPGSHPARHHDGA